MKTTKPSTKQKLRRAYEKACNGYLAELLRMWELDKFYAYWANEEVGGLLDYGCGEFSMNMDNIIFCVENDIEEKEYHEWLEYCVFAHEYKQDMPSFPSWHKGCPRLSKEQQDKLIALKRNLNDCINEYKEQVNQNNHEKNNEKG